MLHTHEAAGSSPAPPTSPHLERTFAFSPPSKSPSKACALPQNAVEAFLLSRRVANCSHHTIAVYERNLGKFVRTLSTDLGVCTSLDVQRYLSGLSQRLKPISTHQHFRTLRTFFTWCVETGVLQAHPMRGLSMQLPKTLPTVPEDDHVRRLLQSCSDAFEGRRNRALIALLADSALRISEALRLRIEDVNFATRTVMVRGGKGAKDGVGFFGSEAAQYLRVWLTKRMDGRPEEYLFVDRSGRSLRRDYATHTLHKLSVRAGLPRKVGPHALRHYAATSILRQTGDLELVRQVLRHESLTMALRYARLTKPDVSAKFRRASPLDNLRAGR
jgi:site-specific recombinase XerD